MEIIDSYVTVGLNGTTHNYCEHNFCTGMLEWYRVQFDSACDVILFSRKKHKNLEK